VAGSDGMAEAMPFQSFPWANLVRVFLKHDRQELTLLAKKSAISTATI
jgi:hypothetical protein